MNYKLCLAVAVLFLNPGCHQTNQKTLVHHLYCPRVTPAACLSTALDIQTPDTSPTPITIWVHGTRLFPQGVFEKFFYSKPGLNHYTSIDKKFQQRKLAQTLIESNTKLFCPEHFYLFGWNGALSFEEREKAAKKLYDDLKKVRAEYKKAHGLEPIIRIITHSHGGNVALLLEKVKDPSDVDFHIQALILLATPVQKQTMHYAHADLFGKVYALYSMLDILQVIDPQGWQQDDTETLFSERFFPAYAKVEQVAIKVNNRSIMHIEFVQRKFISQLSKILNAIDAWQQSTTLCADDWAQKSKCLCISTKRNKTNSFS